jgi:hypothetical protein
MADAKIRTATTLDEANDAGFVGSHVDVLHPDAYTLQGVTSGPAVTDDAYAKQRAAEHKPPDVTATSAPAPEPAASSSKSTPSKSSGGSASS